MQATNETNQPTPSFDSALARISEAALLCDETDLPALADLHTQFCDLAAAPQASQVAGFCEAATQATTTLKGLILGDEANPRGAMERIGETLAKMQSLLRDHAQSGAPNQAPCSPEPQVGDAAPDAQPDAPAATDEAEAEAAPAASTGFEGDAGLVADFIAESREHLETADLQLLELESDPTLEEAVNAVFRAFHTIKGVSGLLGLADIQKLAHECETLLDLARKGTLTLTGRTLDVVFDSAAALKRMLQSLQDSLAQGQCPASDPGLPQLFKALREAAQGSAGVEEHPVAHEEKPLGAILVEQGKVEPDVIESVMTRQRQTLAEPPRTPRLGELLVREGVVTAKDVATALRSQKTPGVRQSAEVRETVKVDAERLDWLVETIGEMVIAESMVSQSPEVRAIASNQLERHLSQLDKITRELQEMGTSLRMVPLRATFQKMALLVRDLAKKSGKRVDFVVTGEETELDKTVVDRIGDPLVHMIRNSVDHGLENDAAERLKANKPEVGRVELRAFHKGGNIFIEVSDDGKGLNRAAIMAKAVERGLVREDETLSDRDLFALIFRPGFSTAKKITDVSGRGVGMDVVKRNIEALRGQVEVASEPGQGTTITIRLPLTLAIIDGLVVRIGHERFVIPTLSIVRSIRPKAADIQTVFEHGEMLNLHDQLIPLFRLGRLYGVPDCETDPTQAIVTVVESGGKQAAILVDELLGQQQTVIKGLGESLRGTEGLSGAAIMTDGRVGLILDIGGVIELAHNAATRAPLALV